MGLEYALRSEAETELLVCCVRGRQVNRRILKLNIGNREKPGANFQVESISPSLNLSEFCKLFLLLLKLEL